MVISLPKLQSSRRKKRNKTEEQNKMSTHMDIRFKLKEGSKVSVKPSRVSDQFVASWCTSFSLTASVSSFPRAAVVLLAPWPTSVSLIQLNTKQRLYMKIIFRKTNGQTNTQLLFFCRCLMLSHKHLFPSFWFSLSLIYNCSKSIPPSFNSAVSVFRAIND